MKKIILTACAAMLFSVAIKAQQRTTNQNRNSRTEQKADSAASEIKKGAREVKQDMDSTSSEIKQDVKETSEEIRHEADHAGNKIQNGAERTGAKTDEKAKKTDEAIHEDAHTIKSEMNSPKEYGNNTDSTSQAGMTSYEVEILDSKEGPNNEVVYKYQNELYYVDRDEQKLVKVEESNLKEAKNKAVVKTYSAQSKNVKNTKKTKKGNKNSKDKATKEKADKG